MYPFAKIGHKHLKEIRMGSGSHESGSLGAPSVSWWQRRGRRRRGNHRTYEQPAAIAARQASQFKRAAKAEKDRRPRARSERCR